MRLGHINFLNVLPLTYGYTHLGIEPINGVPTFLNRELELGRLDVSQISSIAFARMSDRLTMLPDFCVRADDDVQSIILVSRRPINELDGERVILTSKSATAQCLLKIILSKAYDARPIYETRPVDVNAPIDDDATASLLIGDDALYIYHHRPTDYNCYDVGREWHRMTGRSMVYAVWAARTDFDDVDGARALIKRAMVYGLEHKAEAIRAELPSRPFTFEQLDQYLGGVIKWDLTAAHLPSLRLYYKLAEEIGLIERAPAIEIIERR
ncbi:MAG: menaquinone biosynthesis protein [Selenomonadaceae bacterium]|nr:menaquinone biosynthesis protein [Selenomonadaceae bacterium]